MLRRLYGNLAIRTKQDEGKNLTTFESLVLLKKVDKNRAGSEMLTVRDEFLEMGLKVIASNKDEIKSRRRRIEEMYGIEGDTKIWEEYKNNPGAREEGLQAAGACIVLVATLERGGAETLDEFTFVNEHGDKVAPERTSMLSTVYLAKAADMLSR
jgi:hypothetical protein